MNTQKTTVLIEKPLFRAAMRQRVKGPNASFDGYVRGLISRDLDETKADRAKAAAAIRELDPPHYITIDAPGDTDCGQMYWPVDIDDLMGQGSAGSTQRRYSMIEILAALPEQYRTEVKKAVKKGWSPVLFVDLLSGTTALEMRKYTPPSPRIQRLWNKGAESTTMFFKELSPKKKVIRKSR